MPQERRAPRPSLTALSLLQREIDQLFARLAEVERWIVPARGEWVPSLDVYECRGSLVIVAEVPGPRPRFPEVVCRERELSSPASGASGGPPGIAGFLCMERPQGRFKRTMPCDVAVDVKQAERRAAGGVLTITMPRLKDRRGREIEIPVERGERR